MRRVLVVDDDKAVAEVLRDFLQMLGYDVVVLDRVKEALELCTREEFDLIFSDLRMPDMKGDRFLEELRKRGSPMAKRFFIITGADVDEAFEIRLAELGGKLIRKPFYLNNIKEAIESLQE